MFEKIKKVFVSDATKPQVNFEPIPNKKVASINTVQTEEMSFDDYVDDTPIQTPTLIVNVEKDFDQATISGVNKYRDLCDFAGYKWGVSPNLVTAMICQESRAGVLSDNLFQIEFDTNKGEVFTAYNYIDNKYENIVLTDNPADYYGKGYICITRQDLQNPKTNISVGTAILASRAAKMNYHIPSTIQSYNFGVTRTNNALILAGDKASQQLDQTNVNFMNYNKYL